MSIVRIETDVGLLTNRRMSIETALGVAALSGRRLSMDWSARIGNAPGARPAADPNQQHPLIHDLWDIDAELVTDDEWSERSRSPIDEVTWGPFPACVYLGDDVAIPTPAVREFANGRTRFVRLRDDGTDIVVNGRPLSNTSYFFHATGHRRRTMLDAVSSISVRPEYATLADRIACDLGYYQVVHVRRSDIARGIPPYGEMSAEAIGESVASFLPRDCTLVIATEDDPDGPLFDPFRQHFGELVFLNDLILGDHASGFGSLPVHEDNALGLVTQEVAIRADRFVGTFGSTFTGYIHRERCRRDHTEPFLFTCDYSPPGSRFENGQFIDQQPGRYSWNRSGIAFSTQALAWLREWPETAVSPDDEATEVETTPRDTRSEPIHTVVCTDTNPYGQWQVEFLAHTWNRAGQPGELLRLVGCPDGQRPAPAPHARVFTTSARNDHPDVDAPHPGFNRLWSLQEWLAVERPTGSVMILDSDMAFRSTARFVAEPGEVVGQEWFDARRGTALADLLADYCTAPADRIPPVTWPVVLDADDLAGLLPRWLDLYAAIWAGIGAWESDMYAFAGAVAESELTVRYETTGAWMNWPEDFVAGAPIIHYPQPVIDRRGVEMWFKQRYRAFEPLGVDPNDAELDYCRDLLHLLDEYIGTRSRGDK